MGVVHAKRPRYRQEEVDSRVLAWRLFAKRYPDFVYVLTFHMKERFGVTPEEAIRRPRDFHRMLSELVGEGNARYVERVIEETAAREGIIVIIRRPPDLL